MERQLKIRGILDLPDGMIEQILEFLSYDEVAKKRLVSVKFNAVCKRVLNHGFFRITKMHGDQLKAIKSKLPRRESERRIHPLSKFSDILTCIETRLSMLSMTFLKYIEMDICCFIPGKVIDEVLIVLRQIAENQKNNVKPLRAHEVLQELRDVSSMAIEHFDEKIVGDIKKTMFASISAAQASTSSYLSASTDSALDLLSESISSNTIVAMMQSNPLNSQLEPDSNRQKFSKLLRINKIALSGMSVINKQYKAKSQMVKKQSILISKLYNQMKNMKRRMDESEIKIRELSAKFDVTMPVPEASTSTRNIRPRHANIILKRRLEKN